MSSFTFLLVCFQAFFFHNVYCQCLNAGLPNPYGLGYGPGIAPAALAPAATLAPGLAGSGAYGLSAGLGGLATGAFAPAAEIIGAYGGAGIGDVAVIGEMPVAGTTLVAGQVPILGAVRFAGDLPAAGTVSIAGSCGCGCGNAGYIY